jgi:hypothetical protein
MRFVKYLAIVLAVVALGSVAMAKEKANSMGIRDVNHVKFETAVRVGTSTLPAGEYVVRHTMQGQDHIMSFESVRGKDKAEVKCTLVPLAKKAEKNEELDETSSNGERVVRELVFRGDKAKHVF